MPEWDDPAFATALWVGATLAVLAVGRLRADLVALAALLVGVVAGLVPAGRATAGFGSDAVLVLGTSCVLAAMLERSGLTAWPARLAARQQPPGRAARFAVGVLAAAGAALSGRTGARSALLSAVAGGPQGGVLRPVVEYACLLGGALTLVGGAPNLFVSELRARSMGQGFAVFDPLPAAGLACLAGLVVLAVSGARSAGRGVAGASVVGPVPGPGFGGAARGYTSEIAVPPHAAIIGRSVADLEAAEDGQVRVIGLVREDFRRFEARPDWRVEADDVLVLACEPEVLQRWMERYGLRIVGAGTGRAGNPVHVGVVEAIVTPASELVGRTTGEARMDERFGANLLAIGRGEGRPSGRLRRTKVRAGDVLVLQGRLDTLDAALGALGCLKLAERRLRLDGQRGSALPLVLLAAALAAAAWGTVPLWVPLAGAALFAVFAAVLTPADGYDAIPWPGLVVAGALLPMMDALVASGAAGVAGAWLAPFARLAGPFGTVGAIMAAGMAGVALAGPIPVTLVLAPVALALAGPAGMNADMLLIAVALGASLDVLARRLLPGSDITRREPGLRQLSLRAAAPVFVCGMLAVVAVWGRS